MADTVMIAQTILTDEDKAYQLARGAVESRLAAGAQVEARMTLFHWEGGKLRHERGYRVSLQTTEARLEELRAWAHADHTSPIPQWVVLPVTETTEEYLGWVVKETGGA
ncbi:divalent cation tolerance protein CutA [Streptomyces sp. NPDC048606]|uniref:divalent cation tolerance protein CutA n=1 Tax=Streptomyces sp. NPDC048606 TaxID=3154726 RepID=UPI003420837A